MRALVKAGRSKLVYVTFSPEVFRVERVVRPRSAPTQRVRYFIMNPVDGTRLPTPFYDSELQLFRAHDAPPFTLEYPDGRAFDHAGGAQPAERVNSTIERAMTLNKCKVRAGDVQWRSRASAGDVQVDRTGASAKGGARPDRATLLPLTLHAARTRYERALERMDAASSVAREVQRAVASLYEPHTRAEFDATLARLAKLTARYKLG